MPDVSTIRIQGGPFPATGIPSLIIPPNAFVGEQYGVADEGFPETLINGDAQEGMLSANTGMTLGTSGFGDHVAVGQPGMYLIRWSYILEADNPPTGFLGTIGLRATVGNLVIQPGTDLAVVAHDEAGEGRTMARGSSSEILWLGTDDGGDSFQFQVLTDRDDITNVGITVSYTATLIQSGGQPRLQIEG